MIWGPGDEATLPRLKEAMDTGRFAWVNGGRNDYSTCHVDNVAEAVVCALSQGCGGHAYFVTDGVVRTYREVIESQLSARYGYCVPARSLPRWLAHPAALILEAFWRITNRSGAPPITRSLLNLMTYTFVVHDARARRELGYRGNTTVQAALDELAQAPASA
jgi:nucleoside-diphosphate-sugar epimerase